MKKLSLLTLLCYLLVATPLMGQAPTASAKKAAKATAGAADAKAAQNKQTALTAIQAFDAGNIDAAFKDYASNVVIYRGGTATSPVGLDSLKKMTEMWHSRYKAAFPDAKDQMITALADGNYVMVLNESTGTWKNDFINMKATGKTYKLSDVVVFKFDENQKIAEAHHMLPLSSVMRQVNNSVEFDLNNAGYALLREKKYNEAIEVLKLNTKLYPQSANTFDSLGEAYAMAGNTKLAIENYEKSVKMDPNNEDGKKMLAKLKAK